MSTFTLSPVWSDTQVSEEIPTAWEKPAARPISRASRPTSAQSFRPSFLSNRRVLLQRFADSARQEFPDVAVNAPEIEDRLHVVVVAQLTREDRLSLRGKLTELARNTTPGDVPTLSIYETAESVPAHYCGGQRL